MNQTIAQEQQNDFSTQTLVKGQVLEYLPQTKKFFEKEILDDKLLPNTYIIRWDWLSLASPIDTEPKFDDKNVFDLGKKYFETNKKDLLKKYQNKYIAILNNKVIGSDRDFSKLARGVYKKYGYQTIYMPFVEIEERVVKIPSPRIRIQ